VVRMFVRHQVADYPAWRSVYDSIDETRASMGVTGHAVFRSTTDERDVTAYHDFESEDAAQAFASSPALRDAMGRAGVQGAPQIWFTTAA
jgi:quinol monooxygenase YgiN